MKNLSETKCRECGSFYDTPHHQDCSLRRATTTGKPQILVKYNHVDLEEEEDDLTREDQDLKRPA